VVKNVAILALFLLALAPRASAQLRAGETTTSMSGSVTAGYSDDYSNFAGSDHGIIFAGNADVSGSYYSPNFLSFEVLPYYNQSRVNSNYQSIFSSSGVGASAQLFSGTPYGGSISYSAAFDSSGNFNLPGVANFTTRGNNDVFSVTWGAHPHDLPSLNFSFSNANSNYSIFGTNAQGTVHSNAFSVSSGYQVAGFNLNGGYQYSDSKALTPELLSGELPLNTNTGTNSLYFDVSHNLPCHGSIAAAATRIDLSTDLGSTASGDRYDTTIDTLTGTINLIPRPNLSLGGSTYYTDNLAGTLYNTLLTTGVIAPQNVEQPASHDLTLTGYANYEMPAEHVSLHGFVERQQQSYTGISFASDSYNGTADYSNWLLGGSFNGLIGVTGTMIDTTHQSLLGLNGSLNYTRKFHRWSVAGGFNYSQDTQTVLIAYTTSGYNFNGSVGRRFGRRSYWGATASAARSLLTNQPGSANSSHSYSTSLSLDRFSISGGYSASSGNALLTSTGLVPTPVPLPIINPADVVLFNGKSYSVGLGAYPIRGLSMSASFARSLSDTLSNSISSNNNNETVNALITYYFRKVNFTAGYTRLAQGFSVSGTGPTMVGSMFVGISRSFNFF
jgi:hypothetical protein